MNEVLEDLDTPETEKMNIEVFTERQSEAIELIRHSNIPDKLKTHFEDMLRIFGEENIHTNRAKQILTIADELNLAKRIYLDENKVESIPEANELISNIVNIYTK